MTPWPSCCSIMAAMPSSGTGSSTQRCLVPLHSLRSASRTATRLTFSPCLSSSIHLWADSALHLGTSCLACPGTAPGAGLPAGFAGFVPHRQTRLAIASVRTLPLRLGLRSYSVLCGWPASSRPLPKGLACAWSAVPNSWFGLNLQVRLQNLVPPWRSVLFAKLIGRRRHDGRS